jgi:hypothetical protein
MSKFHDCARSRCAVAPDGSVWAVDVDGNPVAAGAYPAATTWNNNTNTLVKPEDAKRLKPKVGG